MTAAGTPPGKAWSGRFTEGADPTAEAFTSSLSFDRRLWPYDLVGSAAWARALERAKLITPAELMGARSVGAVSTCPSMRIAIGLPMWCAVASRIF